MKVYEGIPLERLCGEGSATLIARPIAEAEALAIARERGAEFPVAFSRAGERAMEALRVKHLEPAIDYEETFLVFRMLSWNNIRWWRVTFTSDADGELPAENAFDD